MQNRFLKIIFSTIFNALIFCLCLYAFITIWSNANDPATGAKFFYYYTCLSNLFLCIIAGTFIPLNIISIIKNKYIHPKIICILKLFSTVTVTITFLVVITFLGPTMGYKEMLSGPNLYLHMLCPILAIVTLLAFDILPKFKFTITFYNLIPTLLYFIEYLILVFGVNVGDFYQFFAYGPGFAILILLLILGATYGLGVLYRLLINRKSFIITESEKKEN